LNLISVHLSYSEVINQQASRHQLACWVSVVSW